MNNFPADPSRLNTNVSLYVGDLAKNVDENILYETFLQVGPLASVKVCRDSQSRTSLGYGYVNYTKPEDAQRALDTMNFQPINGRPCRIMWSHRDPTLRRSGKGNIFIKNLPKDIDTSQLNDVFSEVGEILSCKVATDPNGESRGYGFVHFADEANAQRAIELLDGKHIVANGEKDEKNPPLLIMPFKARSERGSGSSNFTNVYVKNMPREWTEEDLDKIFGQFGKITSSKIAKDEEGKSKGFGFVNFEKHEEAKASIQDLHEKVLKDLKENTTLYVSQAKTKAQRTAELQRQREERQRSFFGANLYTKNFPESYADEDLVKLFEQFGDITSAKIMRFEDGKSKGFGFVCFSTQEEATVALQTMNGHMIDGKPLYVSVAQTKAHRRAENEARNAVRFQKPVPMPGFPQAPQMFHPQQAYFQGRGGPYYPPQHMLAPQQFAPGQRGPAGAFIPPHQNGAAGAGGAQNPRMMRGPAGAPHQNYQLMPVPTGNGQGPRGPHPGQQQRGGPRGPGRRSGGPQQRGRPAPQSQQPQAAPAPAINIADLSAKSPEEQRAIIGEVLYHKILEIEPDNAPKLTGMLLEIDHGELVELINNQVNLEQKVAEGMNVLRDASAPEEKAAPAEPTAAPASASVEEASA